MSHNPLISVISISYNCKDELEATIQNILKQSYSVKELVLIDGGSMDGTVEVIQKYSQHIDYFVTERDKGIYDAMNKGIAAAKGEWIIFMNAGDFFYNENVLTNIFGNNTCNEYDFIYGNHVTRYPDYQFENISLTPLNGLWKKLPFSHQSLFTRAELLKRRKFDTSYKIVADQDLVYEAYVRGAKFLYTNLFISISTLGGVSDLKRVESYMERKKFIAKYPGSRWKVLYFHSFVIIERVKGFIKTAIGPSMLQKAIKTRNRIFRNIKNNDL